MRQEVDSPQRVECVCAYIRVCSVCNLTLPDSSREKDIHCCCFPFSAFLPPLDVWHQKGEARGGGGGRRRDEPDCFMPNWLPRCSLPVTNQIHSSRHLEKKKSHADIWSALSSLWATFQPGCSAVRTQSKQELAQLWSESSTLFLSTVDDDEATLQLCAKRSGLGKLRIYKIKAERDSGKRRYAQVLFGVEPTMCAADSEVCYKEQSNSAPEGSSTSAHLHRILISASQSM